ncbi:ROK family protein [Roseateles sp. NT4]|uniref:ROK family protein n=1 Tax=Roseateles sp. NT4 TaxID=3453715 RepID=UPI003EEB91A6
MTAPGTRPPFSEPREMLVADVGGTRIRLARYLHGHECELLADVPTPANDWEQFCAVFRDAVPPAATGSAALSISIAGVVSPTGQVTAANIPCLTSRSLADELAALLGMPVVVTNDADCAALAEARAGAGAGHAIVFCAVLGTGVGGGLVVDGQLVRGAGGLTGEWGHGPVVNEALVETGDGRSVRVPRLRCGCGLTGCIDTVGGARGLERLHGFLHGLEQSSVQILQAWAAADPFATATVRAYIDLVSGPLALVVNVTGASVVPVCGGLGRSREFVSALDQAVRQQILRDSDAALVVPSTLNDQAGLIGAAYAFAGAR